MQTGESTWDAPHMSMKRCVCAAGMRMWGEDRESAQRGTIRNLFSKVKH